jgi:tetratricopeptide (TPR) repeat protein
LSGSEPFHCARRGARRGEKAMASKTLRQLTCGLFVLAWTGPLLVGAAEEAEKASGGSAGPTSRPAEAYARLQASCEALGQKLSEAPAGGQRLQLRRSLAAVYWKMGRDAESKRQWEAARGELLAGVDGKRKMLGYFAEEGRRAMVFGQDAKATMILEVAAEQADENTLSGEVRYRLGMAYLRASRYADAAEQFRWAMENCDRSSYRPLAIRRLAFVLMLRKGKSEALAMLEYLASEYPDSLYAAYAAMRKGEVLAFFGRRGEAIEALESAVKSYPQSKYAWYCLKRIKELRSAEYRSVEHEMLHEALTDVLKAD